MVKIKTAEETKRKEEAEAARSVHSSSVVNRNHVHSYAQGIESTGHLVDWRRSMVSDVITAAVKAQQLQQESRGMYCFELVENPGGTCVVIALPRRTDEDRKKTTVQSCKKAMGPLCNVYQYAGVMGRGRMEGGKATSKTDEHVNKKFALKQLMERLAKTMGPHFFALHGHVGVLPDATWCLSEQKFEQLAPGNFEDQKPAYTKGASAGMVGCCGSHFHIACELVMSPAVGFFVVVENDVRLDKALVRSTLDALEKVPAWDVCLLHRGMVTPMVTSASPTTEAPGTSRAADAPTNFAATEETTVISFTKGSSKLRLVWSSRVCGGVAYVLSRKGATKIANSGYHKEIFCYDDFLNLANRNSTGTHFNSALEGLDCIQYIRRQGGLAVLAVVDKDGKQPPTVTSFNKKAFDKSDTSYDIV